jgi:hypothetical protein
MGCEAGEAEAQHQRPGTDEATQEWLDETIDYIDYWRADVVEKDEPIVRDEIIPEDENIFTRVVRRMRELAGGEGETPEGEEEEPEMRTVRRRVITNAVVADGEWVKKPVAIPGYNRLPFIRYPGIKTGLEKEDGALSVLFPITGGKPASGSKGIAAAQAELLNMRQEIIERFANAAIVTDSANIDRLDFTLGAVNQIEQGKTWSFIVPPGPNPAVAEQMGMLEKLTEDATVSAAMRGQYVGELSGLALTAVNNPVLMRVAHRQQIRERAYQAMNELILGLTEEYAPTEGWYVWGPDKKGAAAEAQLRPAEINGYHRNRVKLTASLPKDEAGEIMSRSNLVDKGQLSIRSFLDYLQQTTQMASQSPEDEMKQILIGKLLLGGKLTEKLQELVASDWDPMLAQLLAEQQAPQGQPGSPPGPPGPMAGMPPGVVAPQAMAAGMPLQAQMGMQGMPPPGPGGVPRGPGG